MDPISREEADQFLKDISFIKKAIEKNTSVLQQLDFRRSLRLAVLLSSIATFGFCGLFHVLTGQFGSFGAIPYVTKGVTFGAMAIVAVLIGVGKNIGVLKNGRSVDPSFSLSRLLREYYTFKVYHQYLPLASVTIFALAYVALTGNYQLIIPIGGIGIGLLFNSFGSLLRIDELLWAGYWFIASGGIVLVFHEISPLLGISLVGGCGLLLLSALFYLPRKKQLEA